MSLDLPELIHTLHGLYIADFETIFCDVNSLDDLTDEDYRVFCTRWRLLLGSNTGGTYAEGEPFPLNHYYPIWFLMYSRFCAAECVPMTVQRGFLR